MMKIVLTLTVVFIMAFLFIFLIVYRGNKEEKIEEQMNGLLITFVSFMLALLPTIVIAVILFALLGSANVVNELFSLEISLNKLMMLSIAFLLYLFTVDFIVEVIVKYMIGKNFLYYVVMLLARISLFFIISAFVGLNDKVSILFATGVAFIVLCFDYVNDRKGKNTRTNND